MRRFDTDTQWGKDKYLLLESGDLTTYAKKVSPSKFDRHWMGNSYKTFLEKLELGDPALVNESERFLNQIEDQVPMSRGWRNLDDVVGAIPNVPAFLAGHPQCMRRRERVMRETSPLAIFMDLTSSAGVEEKDVEKRGVVLLALTRCLVEHRPVELWVGTALGDYSSRGGSYTTAWCIDTRPLDLARAAFHISATVMSRGFGYGLCQGELGAGGNWPFDSYQLHCDTAKQRLLAVFSGQDILYIPPIMLGDELTRDPVGWVKRTLANYIQKDD